MKLLIVDDDVALLDALRLTLQLRGMAVDVCNRAADAAAKVGTGAYDFVLLDYKMPDKDGIWFMENANVPRSTKVLLMTAYLHREVINRMFELGASGYLIKPFDEEELLRNLEFHSRS